MIFGCKDEVKTATVVILGDLGSKSTNKSYIMRHIVPDWQLV